MSSLGVLWVYSFLDGSQHLNTSSRPVCSSKQRKGGGGGGGGGGVGGTSFFTKGVLIHQMGVVLYKFIYIIVELKRGVSCIWA